MRSRQLRNLPVDGKKLVIRQPIKKKKEKMKWGAKNVSFQLFLFATKVQTMFALINTWRDAQTPLLVGTI